MAIAPTLAMIFFAWFSSTESKSRINFLNCLSQGKTRLYTLNAGAIEYMAQNKHADCPIIEIRKYQHSNE